MAEFEIQISKMTEADIDQVLELGMTATEFTFDPHAEHLYTKARLQGLISSHYGILLIARAADDIAGFSISSYHPGFEDGEIRFLEVTGTHGNNGVADQLLDKTLEELRKLGCKRVISWVRPGDYSGLSLFTKHDFYAGRSFFHMGADL